MAWYVLLVVAVALERLAELSRRNLAWSRARGGVEFGAGHYSVMVTLHTGLVVACLVDGVVRSSPHSAG
jgi:methyltransferase